MDAPGPEALMPAHATQLCHPLILWIWLLTVWADERSDVTAKRNSATARMETFLIFLFTIIFTPGDFLPRHFYGEAESNDRSTLLQPFSICFVRNQKSRTTR